jgi:hypothetical protein
MLCCVVEHPMSKKLYKYKTKYGKVRYYNTHTQLMNNIRDVSDGIIDVYVLEEEIPDAREYKRSERIREERNAKLNEIVNSGESLVSNLMELRKILKDYSDRGSSKANRLYRYMLKNGLDNRTFKNMINNYSNKYWILYEGPDTVEWYELILKLHNFRILSNPNADEIRHNNFDKAKSNLKNKKNEYTKIG